MACFAYAKPPCSPDSSSSTITLQTIFPEKRDFMQRFLLLLIILSWGLVACQSTLSAESTTIQSGGSGQAEIMPVTSADEIALGKTVYAANCAACHGVNLEGEANWKQQNEDGSFRSPPHDESGHTWHHGDPTLVNSIVLGGARLNKMNIGGTSAMPAFGELLTDGEITAVLTFIKSTWPNDVRQLQREATIREQARASE
ncbi:MAG: cytochrome c [Chloroflexi bacterium]|nr:MAG: cytochrome c [Chloroflexota bacterium]